MSSMLKSEMTAKEFEQFLIRVDMSNEMFGELVGVTNNAVMYWVTDQRKIPSPIARLVRFFGRHPELIKTFALDGVA